MRKALVDNSTLTAVQRLNRDILVKNKHVLNGDILAMESLLQAILFFDEVFYLGDYKPELMRTRKQLFSGLQPLRIEEDVQTLFTKETLQQTELVVPRIIAGSFVDNDFKPFLDMLRMNLWYVWNMSSSIFYWTCWHYLAGCPKTTDLTRFRQTL